MHAMGVQLAYITILTEDRQKVYRQGLKKIICMASVAIQWNSSIMDTKDFVLYSEVSIAQGVFVDHAPLTIVANYAETRLWIMKSVVLIKDLLIFSPYTRIKDLSGLYCNDRSLILTDDSGGCG